MSEKDNHLSFGTKNKEFSFAEKTEQAVENLKPEIRKQGQSIRDYIQNEGSHTGIVGAITGTIIAVASFVADVVGSVARNLLWSQQMQEAIADRMRRTSPRKTTELVKESEKEKGITQEKKAEEQAKEESGSIASILKAYNIETAVIGDNVYLQGKKDKVFLPSDYKDPEKIYESLSKIKGKNLSTALTSAMIATAYQNKQNFFTTIQYDIPTKRGNIHLKIDDMDNCIRVKMNNKIVFRQLPKDVLSRPELFSKIKKEKDLIRYMEKEANRVLSQEKKLTKDISLTINSEQNIILKKGKDVIYEGKSDMKKFEEVFKKYPIEKITEKEAAAALTCILEPQKINREYFHKNIFTNKEYEKGHAYVSIGQNCFYLNEPKKVQFTRSVGEFVAHIEENASTSQVASALQISKEDAKRAKNLEYGETILVKSGEKTALLTNHEDKGLLLYTPKEIPDVIKKRAIDPYLREHADKLPSLVEKDGKLYTAIDKGENGISYESPFINEEIRFTDPTEFPRMSPDEIGPEEFLDFAGNLREAYEMADQCKIFGKKEDRRSPEFHYVKEESDSQKNEQKDRPKENEHEKEVKESFKDSEMPFKEITETDNTTDEEDIEVPFDNIDDSPDYGPINWGDDYER